MGRSLRILLFDSFLPRTLGDNRAACPVVDFVPKVRALSDGCLLMRKYASCWTVNASITPCVTLVITLRM